MASDRPTMPESSFLADPRVATGHTMDQPELGRGGPTGLMIIRAWVEEGSREPLRVQIRHTTDVSGAFQRTTSLSSIADAAAVVEGWLTDVMTELGSPE